MESKIKEILIEMAEYLSAEQQKKLQQVLLAKLAENQRKPDAATNEEYKKLFLSAKKIEGCSERTIIYYGTTLDHFFGSVKEPVRRITTERIRVYLADYQKINNCSKGDGGYALKLSPSLFGEDVFSISEDPYGKFSCIQGCKVIYKAEEKIAFLSDKILNVYSAYQHDTECVDPMKEAEYILLKYFQTFQYKFKHECFSSEQEYRFIFYLPHKKPEKVQQILPQIEYETKNGVVIPHIEWEIEDGKSNLFEVVISPYVTEAYAEATTRDLLKSRGFTQCDVTKSVLPVRF